ARPAAGLKEKAPGERAPSGPAYGTGSGCVVRFLYTLRPGASDKTPGAPANARRPVRTAPATPGRGGLFYPGPMRRRITSKSGTASTGLRRRAAAPRSRAHSGLAMLRADRMTTGTPAMAGSLFFSWSTLQPKNRDPAI